MGADTEHGVYCFDALESHFSGYEIDNYDDSTE